MFDITAQNAASYLRARGVCDASWRISELGGGVSNTVLLVESDTQRFVLKQSLAKLRVEQDWYSDRERIFREARAMRRLAPHLPGGAVPDILFEDPANCLFAMSAAPPTARPWKSLLLAGEISLDIAGRIGSMLATMGRVSWHQSGWETDFGDQTVFNQLRMEPYYRTTALRHPDLAARFERLREESRSRRVCLVHGDWSPKNFLVDREAVTAIDFEVIHFGDPAFDSAFLLNHLLLKSFYRPEVRDRLALAAARFWGEYRRGLPPDSEWLEAATLRHLGCLLLARLDGKSPVEYLKDPEVCERVRRFARELILEPPASVSEAFERWK